MFIRIRFCRYEPRSIRASPSLYGDAAGAIRLPEVTVNVRAVRPQTVSGANESRQNYFSMNDAELCKKMALLLRVPLERFLRDANNPMPNETFGPMEGKLFRRYLEMNNQIAITLLHEPGFRTWAMKLLILSQTSIKNLTALAHSCGVLADTILLWSIGSEPLEDPQIRSDNSFQDAAGRFLKCTAEEQTILLIDRALGPLAMRLRNSAEEQEMDRSRCLAV